MTQLSKTGVMSVLSSTVKLLTLSFFVGFGLASCSHSSGEEGEAVETSSEAASGDAAPAADGLEAPAMAEGAEAAPVETVEASKPESDAPPVLDEAAPPAELADADAGAEQPVAAVDEAQAPVAPAPEEMVADHPQEPTLPEDDATSDTVKAELTDKSPTPASAAPARSAPEAPAAAPESIADSFENRTPTPEANGAIVDGNSISSPGAARFLKSVHQKKGGRSTKMASTHVKRGKGRAANANAAASAAGGNYVVVPGDTLGRISKKIYGDTKQWKTLADLNGLVDPFLIRIGEVVKFDDTSEKAKAYMSSHKTAMKSVTVKDGDSLSKIAATVYGDSNKWTLLLNLNKDQISDPNHIATGMNLAYVELEGAPAQAEAAAAPAAKPQKATAKAHKKKAPAAAGAVKESH